ncbi:MAG: MarR family transcriptional regulator [Proteobacteria bacterium]|nr:MarR family transcriptional regulator [Pseudomonadota bacterium]
MAAKTDDLNNLVKAVRAAFQRLKALGENLHGDLGVTVAMRAVLETLVENGPRTVPQIAQSKSVTRQHIQGIVDSLLQDGLAALDDNPKHRRSSLVAATRKGQKLFAEMCRREEHALSEIGSELRQTDLKAALHALVQLNTVLEHHRRETRHAA